MVGLGRARAPGSRESPVWPRAPLSDGEIHFLWSFMDGSIMVPETRWRLRHAWGMCQRHGFGWLAMEATFRPHVLMGPAVLYEDLMERAAQAFRLWGPGKVLRLARRLRARPLPSEPGTRPRPAPSQSRPMSVGSPRCEPLTCPVARSQAECSVDFDS